MKEITIKQTDLGIYIGEMVNNTQHGYGILQYKNGSIYDGFWNKGERNGEGMFIGRTGSISCGQWNGVQLIKSMDKNQFPQAITYSNPTVSVRIEQVTQNKDTAYVGQMLNGKKHGYGIYYINDTVYVGNWLHNMKNGYGTLIREDGCKTIAYWRDDEILRETSESPLNTPTYFNFSQIPSEITNKINAKTTQIGGTIYGNVSNASSIYGTDKFTTPRGHGFAAENANHLYDKLTGKQAEMVGDFIDPATGRIVKNGADRIVDGINIQTKYCQSGSKCISECFENGKFRYINADGTPMQVEVPSDMYDAAVSAMENRIKNGQVPGVTDPAEAKNIVRKGHFTYEQAKNIAKAGTVESITFDAVNGAIIATYAFGLSTALSFAVSVWNGESFETAIKTATYSGLKVGGTTFVTAILSGQLSKAGLNSALVGSSEAIVNIMGPKASAMIVNAFRSGSNIYGAAAMKSAAKMLRGNVITAGVSVVVLSSVDIVNIFRGRISGAQLFKNIANTTSTVAGGTAGWVGGAAAGAALGSAVPIIGTAIGGFIGGLAGSIAAGGVAGKVSSTVMNSFIEDDANKMVKIIENRFIKLTEDYLLTQKEAEHVADQLKSILTGSKLKEMFASSNKEQFAHNLLISHVENEVKKRKRITMPTQNQMINGLKVVLEEMY